MKRETLLITSAFFLLMIFAACNAPQKKGAKTTPENKAQTEKVLYVSDNGQQFGIEELNDKEIKVTDENSGTSYTLVRVESASGAKYSNETGYSFWTKGKEFMWMKDEEILAAGKQLDNDFTGSYATQEYRQRDEGYDWVGVIVSNAGTNQLLFRVRSRVDRKKPSCTWDATAFRESEDTFYSVEDGKRILFTFSSDTLTIAPEDPSGENVLYFHCLGGATVAGKYIKIDGELDPEQVDSTVFSKVLQLQGIGFFVTSVRKGPQTAVTVSPFGLEQSNRVETYTVDGFVTDAEIEDLNADGSPELLIYTQSFGSGSYGNVLAFSVNNRKSVSMAYLPPVTQNPALSEGYMGHDEFRIVENSLVQRFPIYNEGDSNTNPTGGIRQITYKLVEGEAMRQFEVKNITTIERQ